jgi:hypothetical protein
MLKRIAPFRKIVSLAFAICLIAWPAFAQTTTWNPSDIGTGLTLSNGNLTATSSPSTCSSVWNYPNPFSHFGGCAVRANASHSTGKYYFEVSVSSVGIFCFDVAIGIGNSGASLGLFAGATTSIADSKGVIETNAVSIFQGGGNDAANVGIATVFKAGDIVQVAVDLTDQLIWFSVNGGAWSIYAGYTGLSHNPPIPADPATGIAGISTSSVTGPFFPMVSGSGNQNPGVALTANFGATSYAYTPPSGFGDW